VALVVACVTEIQDFTSSMAERRIPPTREWLRVRMRSEFIEMPDLILTLTQAVRLFGLRKDICSRVLGELEAEGLLCQGPGERYARRWSVH
jgi:hypothetical protein